MNRQINNRIKAAAEAVSARIEAASNSIERPARSAAAAAASVANTSNNVFANANEENKFQQCEWVDPLQKAVSEIPSGTMARQLCEAFLARQPTGGLQERMAKLQEIRDRFEQN